MVLRDFLRWIETAPVHRRAEAAGALARAAAREEDGARREAIEAAMTILADDASPEVRRALATALAPEPEAPRHLVLHLLADQPAVAEPLAARSALLLDAELVDLVAVGGPRLQRAVAERPVLSRPVAAAIAEVGSRGAVLRLLVNQGAQVPPAAFARAAERFGERSEIREALLQHPDLPVSVRHRLIQAVSDVLGRFVTDHAWLGDEAARRLTRDACDRATVSFLPDTTEAELPRLVAYLRGSGHLTTALMLRALCMGEARFFEEGLAVLTGVPAARVEVLVAEGKPAALKALLARSGLPGRSHEAFSAAITAWRELRGQVRVDGNRFARAMAERTLEHYEPDHADEIDEILALLRRIAAEAARDAARAVLEELASAA